MYVRKCTDVADLEHHVVTRGYIEQASTLSPASEEEWLQLGLDRYRLHRQDKQRRVDGGHQLNVSILHAGRRLLCVS